MELHQLSVTIHEQLAAIEALVSEAIGGVLGVKDGMRM